MSRCDWQVGVKYISDTLANLDYAIFTASLEKLFTTLGAQSFELGQLFVNFLQSLSHFARLVWSAYKL